MEIENLLRDLIKMNTVNDLENKKIMDYLEDYLKKIGFKTEYKTKCLVMSWKKSYFVIYRTYRCSFSFK